MTVCARKPSFLDATLRSLFSSDFPKTEKLTLSVHETDAKCVAQWAGHPQLVFRMLAPKEAHEKSLLATRARVVHATRLALDLSEGPVLLFQDDVEFAPNWWTRLHEVLAGDLPKVLATGKPYPLEKSMIALYSHLDGFAGVREWAPATWWGLQGMYFGEEARKLAVKSLALQQSDWNVYRPAFGHGAPPGADVRMQSGLIAADDVRLKDALLKPHHGIQLFGIWPSLVQHTGHHSSIGSPAHMSPTFGWKGMCANSKRT